MSSHGLIRTLLAERRLPEACEASRSLVASAPNDPQARLLCAIAHAESRAYPEARAEIEQALALAAEHPWTWDLVHVNVLRDSGDLVAARREGERLISKAPAQPEAHNAHGLTLSALNAHAESLHAFEVAIACNPLYVPAYVNAAAVLIDDDRADKAVELLERAVQRNPSNADLAAALATALSRGGRHAYEEADMFSAISAYEAALKLRPHDFDPWIRLGNAYLDVGAVDQAIRCLRAALALRPQHPDVYDTLLVAYHYDPKVGANEMYEAHVEWRRRFAPATIPARPQAKRVDARRLRVGFMSRSMAAGAVPQFLAPLLRHLPRERFVIRCYDAGGASSAALVAQAGDDCNWRNVQRLTDDELVAVLRADDIDVIVDLDGHVPGNRLRALARRVAPVQLTWLDYFDTTGLEVFDFLIGDSVSTPNGGAQIFTEKVLRLDPCRLCYAIPDYAPPTTPPPFLRNGYVTFGSFNRLSKLAEPLLDRWAALMKAIPDSRLIIKNGALAHPRTREVFAQRFVLRGIQRERVDLRGPSPHAQMLAEYGDIDIALDAFPYNGGLTSCEALAMGLPIVALLGDAMISRQTASILTAAGFPQWIARTNADWLRINIELATATDDMRAWRADARNFLRATPLCNAVAFAEKFADLLAVAWSERSMH